MLPYRLQYNESEYDIQNYTFLQNNQKCQNTFEILKSKSTVYPQKQTRTDVSGHAIESLNRCASFINVYFFLFLLYILQKHYNFTYNKNTVNINKKCTKDAHWNYAPDACPETSVRVCFGG